MQTDVVQQLKVKVPSLPDQKIIAGVLKYFDDKIAINRAINENLAA